MGYGDELWVSFFPKLVQSFQEWQKFLSIFGRVLRSLSVKFVPKALDLSQVGIAESTDDAGQAKEVAGLEGTTKGHINPFCEDLKNFWKCWIANYFLFAQKPVLKFLKSPMEIFKLLVHGQQNTIFQILVENLFTYINWLSPVDGTE